MDMCLYEHASHTSMSKNVHIATLLRWQLMFKLLQPIFKVGILYVFIMGILLAAQDREPCEYRVRQWKTPHEELHARGGHLNKS